MKKRIITIFFVFSFLLIVVCRLVNNKLVDFEKNNIIAMTLDGKSIENFPDYNTGKYKVNVNCDNASGSFLPVKDMNGEYNLDLVLDDIKGKIDCTLDFKTIDSSDKLTNAVIKETTYTNSYRGILDFGSMTIDDVNYNIGIRYYNSNGPYVKFNDENWRIIGVMDTMTAEGKIKKLTKIVKADPLGFASPDGDWVNSNVNHLLNDYYLKGLDATNSDYCVDSSGAQLNCNYTKNGIKLDSYYGKMIENVVWYLGGMSSTSTDENYYSTAYTADWFSYERKGIVYGDYAKSTTGYLGIISGSDYGYASNKYSSSVLNSIVIAGSSYVRGLGDALLMNHNTKTGGGFVLDNNVTHGLSTKTSGIYSVYPVAYLSENVYVMDGSGGKNNPYILGM